MKCGVNVATEPNQVRTVNAANILVSDLSFWWRDSEKVAQLGSWRGNVRACVCMCVCLHVCIEILLTFQNSSLITLFNMPSWIPPPPLCRSLFLDNQYMLTETKSHKWLRSVYVSVSAFGWQALWGQRHVLSPPHSEVPATYWMLHKSQRTNKSFWSRQCLLKS